MTERRYTLAEIDEMRRLVEWKMSPRTVVNGVVSVHGGTSYSDGLGGQDRFVPPVAPHLVEDRLRTYMVAGLGPDDLKADT